MLDVDFRSEYRTEFASPVPQLHVVVRMIRPRIEEQAFASNFVDTYIPLLEVTMNDGGLATPTICLQNSK